MDKLVIRNESKNDYRAVEELTREAFWNLNYPGCDEHYLLHVMRQHEDYIPQLDFVAEIDGHFVGNIIYTKSELVDETGYKKDIVTFGPFSVLPAYQRNGIGKALLAHSSAKALEMGYDTIVIFGSPSHYITRGFKSCKKYNICVKGNAFPSAMLVKELKPFNPDGKKWTFYESPVFEINPKNAGEYDKLFEPKEKKYQLSQEEFYIYSHSSIK
ncbi:MAG: N-acetyltransferase [Sporolactobacillus sp.]